MASFLDFFVPGLGSLLGGLGGLFGSKPKSVTTNSNQTSETEGDFSSSTSPVLSDMQSMLANLFGNGLADRYRAGPTDLSGYEAGGLSEINKGADLKSKIISNTLASRGLSYSPYAGAQLAQPESERVGQGVDFLNQMPLLQRQLQQQDLSGLIQGFGALPTGSTTSGSQSGFSNNTGTSTQTGGGNNPFAGLFSGLGAGLFSGLDIFNTKKKS